MIDIGVNLTNPQFESDTEAVLDRAFRAGVEALVLTGTDLVSSEGAQQLCLQYRDKYPNRLFSTSGLHPHEASHWNPEISARLRELAQLPEVVAIGETGLDFNRNFSPKPVQILAFEGQLELAAECQLPLFLHERDAFVTQIEILRSYRQHFDRAVIHCFTGDKKALYAYLDLDLYIGITGWVCDERRGLELAELVSEIPADRLLVETDAPYLLPRNIAPKPSSRRNEPAYLNWVIKKIAECRGSHQSEIAEQTSRNARVFFDLAD